MTTAPADLRFRIGSRTYTAASLEEVSLRDVLLFETQTADMGLPLRWADIEDASREVAGMDKAARREHPQMLPLLGVMIWASRRLAGDAVTFEEAVSFPMSSLEWLSPVEDPTPGAAAGPTKSRKGTRKGSGPASGSGPAKRAAKKTSAPTSEPA